MIESVQINSMHALAERVAEGVAGRDANHPFLVGIAGPPGSGKSTLSELLRTEVNKIHGAEIAAVVPMDGFHLDDAILDSKHQRAFKGAPHTFDLGGLQSLVKRIAGADVPVYVPIFDREREIAINASRVVEAHHTVVLVEGNYLLLNQPGWRDLATLFELTIAIDVPHDEIRRRLRNRWKDAGLGEEAVNRKLDNNDLPNALLVQQESINPMIRFAPKL